MRRFSLILILTMAVFILTLGRAEGRSSLEDIPSQRARPSFKNAAHNFLFRTPVVERISELDAPTLREARVITTPWADSYWPTAKGGIARRWADKSYPDSSKWQENYDYFKANQPGWYSSDKLSAAEKYDLLLNDPSFAFTHYMWAEGEKTLKQTGYVPLWHGLCHGWAPAAFMTPNPMKSVYVRTGFFSGITFYPSDIKALATRAWGRAQFEKKFVGHRCNDSTPTRDENGRVTDIACFEVNPATFHVSILNQVGLDKKSFVFDTTYNEEVWNYPVLGYRFEYFNPQSLEVSPSLVGASIPVEDFNLDKFRKYRAPGTKYVVGVSMTTYHIDVGGPSASGVTQFPTKALKYLYDLEIDAAGVVIGGEWYSDFHPDFIWQPDPAAKALSRIEVERGAPFVWDGVSPLPEEVRAAALEAAKRGEVLWAIVEALENQAR